MCFQAINIYISLAHWSNALHRKWGYRPTILSDHKLPTGPQTSCRHSQLHDRKSLGQPCGGQRVHNWRLLTYVRLNYKLLALSKWYVNILIIAIIIVINIDIIIIIITIIIIIIIIIKPFISD